MFLLTTCTVFFPTHHPQIPARTHTQRSRIKNYFSLVQNFCAFSYSSWCIWWLVELPYRFKVIFLPKILGILCTHYAKDDFTRGKIQPIWGLIEPKVWQNSEKLWELKINHKWNCEILWDWSEAIFTSHLSDFSLLDFFICTERVILSLHANIHTHAQ